MVQKILDAITSVISYLSTPESSTSVINED